MHHFGRNGDGQTGQTGRNGDGQTGQSGQNGGGRNGGEPNGGDPNGQNRVGRETETAGTVYRRVDFPVRDMRPGAEFTLPDTVLNTRSYTADHLAPTEIVTYSRTGRDVGDGQVAQAPGTRMRVLGAHEGAYIAPDGQAGTRLYLVEVGHEPLPVQPAPM
jgi:hypothetical protein